MQHVCPINFFMLVTSFLLSACTPPYLPHPLLRGLMHPPPSPTPTPSPVFYFLPYFGAKGLGARRGFCTYYFKKYFRSYIYLISIFRHVVREAYHSIDLEWPRFSILGMTALRMCLQKKKIKILYFPLFWRSLPHMREGYYLAIIKSIQIKN